MRGSTFCHMKLCIFIRAEENNGLVMDNRFRIANSYCKILILNFENNKIDFLLRFNTKHN